MHYLYVGYYVNEDTFHEILEKKINNMSVARQRFEYNLIRGLSEQLKDRLNVITYVPTDGSVDTSKTSYVGETKIDHIYINKKSTYSMIKAMERFSRYLRGLGDDVLDDLVVVMYAVIPPFLQVLLKMKHRYHIKTVTICSEVPAFRRFDGSIPSKIKQSILSYYNEKFDGYIFFSAAMNEVVKCEGKPTMVLEGIAPDIQQRPAVGKRNIVMYAGGLARDNNVSLLAECCKSIPLIDEVWICGNGEESQKIEQICKEDSRIKYFGRVENSEILKMEQQAKVLVNLRSPDALLTRYSFPSKILEYIASGSLVISTRLIGIPEDYFRYIVPISAIDQEEIVACIKGCLSLAEEDYVRCVVKAQAFTRDNKNYKAQSGKVIDFLQTVGRRGKADEKCID